MDARRIAFVGASGTGKTTLAKYISDKYGIPFLSGSYSDLVPETKDVKHVDMMDKGVMALLNEEYTLINLRRKSYQQMWDGFVTDRSPVDNLAYFIYKLSHKVPQCEVETFESIVERVISSNITHLIFIPFTDVMLTQWETEDNNKRIVNNYFQWQISQLMGGILSLKDYTRKKALFIEDKDYNQGTIRCNRTDIKVLILDKIDIEDRKRSIDKWLKK